MIALTEETVLKPVTWHTAHAKQPVWYRAYGKLREGVISSFGRKNITILDIRNNAEVARPFGEVYCRKVSGPPTLIGYRK